MTPNELAKSQAAAAKQRWVTLHLPRGAAIGYPAISHPATGRSYQGPDGWARLMADVLPGYFSQIERQIDELEAKAARSAQFEHDWNERQQRRRRFDEDSMRAALRDLLR